MTHDNSHSKTRIYSCNGMSVKIASYEESDQEAPSNSFLIAKQSKGLELKVGEFKLLWKEAKKEDVSRILDLPKCQLTE